MRHVDEYRDPQAIQVMLGQIESTITRPWTLMEVCGGQTHSILKFGLDELLPSQIRLIHGPGCPVCVTPLEQIDRALAIATTPGVIFCSFGDMLRVPGSHGDLLLAKARGADVRIVYSPLDAVAIARREPSRRVVFFAVGFETTAPANAMAAYAAARDGLDNFSVLVAHVLVPPAVDALLSAPECEIQGLLAPGHVCVVTGWRDYEALAERHRLPIVVTGFEPLDLLRGVHAAIVQLERGDARVENQYERAAVAEGNPAARRILEEVFTVCDRKWRGMGEIPASGYALAPAYAAFDAERVFGLGHMQVEEPKECLSGLVLQGRLRPTDCPHFGKRCTPEHPLGATMVSSEGACAAYFHYGRRAAAEAAA
ncbi:MAG TPA: hydrogenase formation protein HypD [Candidatus Acidoferrales bacterium]|nr:hydrogenase formation protein HypD [Candidatus Acidoferrales bacterium]